MSNVTQGKPADFSELPPRKKGQVTKGLPSWLQGGKFVMIFGVQRPPRTSSSSENTLSADAEAFIGNEASAGESAIETDC